MSHFTVLVVTDTDEESELEAALQPYHEYECTGCNDEYVVWVDMQDELEEEFKKPRDYYEDEEGKLYRHAPDKWYHEITKEEYDALDKKAPRRSTGIGSQVTYYKLVIPDGVKEVKKSHKDEADKKDMSFDEWVVDYHGYDKETCYKNKRWGRYTNPNAKWDWWVVGGRWSGMLQVKDKEAANKGQPSLLMGGASIEGFDRCQVSNLDLDAILEENKNYARSRYQDIMSKEDEEVKAALMELNGITDRMTEEEYAEANKTFSTYALVQDGEWYQRGKMGWWGITTDEDEDWDVKFTSLLRTLPKDKWVTVVDCHI